MKLKNIIKSTIIGSLLLTAGGCHDDIFYPDGTWTGEVPDEWTMTLVTPDPQIVTVGGTRGDDETMSVDNINVLLYDGSDNIISNTVANSTDWTVNEDNTITLTANLHKNARKIEVVVNAPSSYTDKTEPYKLFTNEVPSADKPVLWGRSSLSDLLKSQTMTMLRNTAMVTVKVDTEAVNNFDISLVGVFGTSEEGSLAPASITNNLPTAVTEKEGGSMTYLPTESDITSNMKSWVGETDKNNDKIKFTSLSGFYETLNRYGEKDTNGKGKEFPRVIIKGRYTDPSDGTSIEGYYVVALAKQDKKNDPSNDKYSETPEYFSYEELMPMLRNHEYVINIKEVRADGWPTLDQALKAKPDNRLTSECEDKFTSITDIEATRDYYLGVGADVTVDYNKNAIINIVTSYPGIPESKEWNKRLSFETENDWILKGSISEGADKEEKGNAIYYTLTIPLQNNTESNDRYGKIRVRAGKLSREIFITQLGCPYTRTKKIEVSGLKQGADDYTNADYFGWIEGATYDTDGTIIPNVVPSDSVKGMSRGANREAVRRNGLHFPAAPLYEITYKIPADEYRKEIASISEGASNFQVTTTSDGYHVVKVKENTEKSVSIATGRLLIENFGGVEGRNVEYPLYRTGIFHYLDGSHQANDPDKPEVRKTGWYYYELVKIGSVYMLDRDLGAVSNLPYSPGSAEYKNNKSAIGGYFKVNTGRWANCTQNNDTKERREDQETITTALGLTSDNGKFIMAREEDLLAINPTCGEVVEVATTGGRVADNKIYFSKSGYYEGSEHKDPMRCKFWTRTYLGGTQGMSTDSKEYGYWYRYFDDMKSTNPENRYSNIRMARGSDGSVPTEASIWRYMPLRLVWVNSDCKNPTTSVTPDDNTVVGKMVIYFEDTQNWGGVQYYAWNLASGDMDYPTRPSMTKVEGKDNLYRVELSAPAKNSEGKYMAAGILFTAPNLSDDDHKTQDYGTLSQNYANGKTVFYFKPNGKANNDGSGQWKLQVTTGSEDKWTSGGGGGGDDPIPAEAIYRIYWRTNMPNVKDNSTDNYIESSFIHLWTNDGGDGNKISPSWESFKKNVDSDVTGYYYYQFTSTEVQNPEGTLKFKLEKGGGDRNSNKTFNSVFTKVGNYYCAYVDEDDENKIYSGKPTAKTICRIYWAFESGDNGNPIREYINSWGENNFQCKQKYQNSEKYPDSNVNRKYFDIEIPNNVGWVKVQVYGKDNNNDSYFYPDHGHDIYSDSNHKGTTVTNKPYSSYYQIY